MQNTSLRGYAVPNNGSGYLLAECSGQICVFGLAKSNLARLKYKHYLPVRCQLPASSLEINAIIITLLFAFVAVFRLGKSVDCIRSAQSSIHLLDPFLRTVLTINHLNRAGFLLIDHYLWLGKTGWKTVDQKWEFQSARFYLATIMLSIIRDLYALHLTAIQLANARRNDKDQAGSAPPVQKLHKALSANVPATLDLVKNLFDFVIPATKLGYIPGKHNGVLGFCGLMSSLIGAYQIARPEIKLKPN